MPALPPPRPREIEKNIYVCMYRLGIDFLLPLLFETLEFNPTLLIVISCARFTICFHWVVSGKIQIGQRAGDGVEAAAGRGRRNSCFLMPPEQLPWDRRDFRKHDRSASDPRFGGGAFGGAGPHRWREQHHHAHAPPPPPAHPPPYHHHHNHHQPQQQRWYSDFRSSRPVPSGHGKQGGWHMYPDDAGHGFLPFGSRYGDRHLEDDNFQQFGSCSDGRYFRTNKENKGSFTQKDWRSSSWEPATASSGPLKPTAEVNNQKFVDNTETCNNSKSNGPSAPLPDSISDQSQPVVQEKQEKVHGAADRLTNSCQKPEKENGLESVDLKHEKVDGAADRLTNSCEKSERENCLESVDSKNEKVDGAVDRLTNSCQKAERENGLESVDWKPLKWTRSGSLPSRGSDFSHMSGTKSIGVDSIEMVAEVQQSVMPVHLAGTSNDVSAAPTSSEEANSRKKPRLGWGEGLAKYEKKKVESPEDSAAKDGLVVNVTTTETMQSPVNQSNKSPRVASMSDCMSPATPSSVACSSSSGIEEKDSARQSNVTQDNINIVCSPCITSQMHYEGPTLNLENLDITSIAKLSSSINEMLRSEDLSSVGTDFVRTMSMSKLLVLKALEVTESSIDSLETELKSLMAEPTVCSPCPAVSSLPPGDCPVKACEAPAASCVFTIEPAPLNGVSSAKIVVDNMPAAMSVGCETMQGGEVINPGSASFKNIEVLSSREDVCPSGTAKFEDLVKLDVNNSNNLSQKGLEKGPRMDVDDFHGDVTADRCQSINIGNRHSDANHIYDFILAANKESASCSLKELKKLLPSRQCSSDISVSANNSSFQRDSLAIKEKFLLRKRSLKFKEKVLTLKFRVFQHFWKVGCVVSLRKLKGKSHKISDVSHSGHKKNRASNRSRISCFASNHRVAAAEEVLKCINELLLESSCKPSRSTLKMPALILGKESMSRFISKNGLVEDPLSVEKERSIVNPWTAEEREAFIDKLSIYGKNFSKIASFLDHRTVADCIEFYYKNHKSECFARARKDPEFSKQRKAQTTTYLVGSGKRWNREVNAASLDILGEASAVAYNANDALETPQRCTPRILFGVSNSHRASNGMDGPLQRSNDHLEIYSNETAAADVLAGICGSRSSEAMSSCITSSFDHADEYQDWKGPRVRCDYEDNVDDECSDESCGEMDSTDWTDEETSNFVQAVSSYGKDFVMVSQLVRTKSKEQCQIFFSKAQKCLGLDQTHAGACNSVPCDAYGGGSDNEDGCVEHTDTIVSPNDSGCDIKEDLPSHEMKVSHESDDVAICDFKPDIHTCEENSRSCPLDSVAAESVLENSLTGDAQMGDVSFTDCSAVSKGQDDTYGSEPQARTFTSSHLEPGRAEEERIFGPADGTNEADKDSLPDSSGSCREESEATGLILPEHNLHTKKVADPSVKSSAFTAMSCAPSEMKSILQQSENVSLPSLYAQSSMQAESDQQNDADFGSLSSEKSCGISSHKNGQGPSAESSMISVSTKDQIHLNRTALGNVVVRKVDEKRSFETVRTRDGGGHHSGYSPLDIVDSTQILRGYPISGQSVKEINEDASSKRHTLQSIHELSGNLHSNQYSDYSMRKCSRHQNEVSQSQGKCSKDNSRPPLGCLADSGTPRNGDVKLFGKILISSQQNPNSCVEETCGDNYKVASCQSLNLGLSGNQKTTFDTPLSKFDTNKFMGSENIPVRGYSFGDGNETLVGFPPLSDPALLLAKYPAAATFGSLSTPFVKLEQQPLHGAVRSHARPLNSVSVFPSRELGVADCQVLRNHREIQSFQNDMTCHQRQDLLISEMQRRNRFDVMQGMQMQQGAMGMLGINVVGSRVGIGRGHQCPAAGVSDPVAAIKMHFAKAQNSPRSAVLREVDNASWRNSSWDVGSR